MESRIEQVLFYLLILVAFVLGILIPGVPLRIVGWLLGVALLVFVVAHRDALWNMLRPGSGQVAEPRPDVSGPDEIQGVIAVVSGAEPLWGWDQLPTPEQEAYFQEYVAATKLALQQILEGSHNPREAFQEVFYILTNWRATAEIKGNQYIRDVVFAGAADLTNGHVKQIPKPEDIRILARKGQNG